MMVTLFSGIDDVVRFPSEVTGGAGTSGVSFNAVVSATGGEVTDSLTGGANVGVTVTSVDVGTAVGSTGAPAVAPGTGVAVGLTVGSMVPSVRRRIGGSTGAPAVAPGTGGSVGFTVGSTVPSVRRRTCGSTGMIEPGFPPTPVSLSAKTGTKNTDITVHIKITPQIDQLRCIPENPSLT
jgi:hypothetical protein